MFEIIKNIHVLKQKSSPVETVKEAKEIISELQKILLDFKDVQGISAIQIGIPKQIALLRNADSYITIVNPVKIEEDESFVFNNEKCISFDTVINTNRFRHYIIENNVIDNDSFRKETQYFYADPFVFSHAETTRHVAVQRQIDLFDGITIKERENKVKKTNRNAPCPCGSGKKYKKCCLV